MRKTIVILLLFCSPIYYPQMDKKFMELRGIEDSLSNTHLYYRMSYYTQIGIGTYYYYQNIYHINLSNQSDVFFLSDYRSGYSSGQGIMVSGFEFWNNDPTKYIYCGEEGPLGIGGWGYIKRHSGICQAPGSLRITKIQISAKDTRKLFCASTPYYTTYMSVDSGLSWTSLAPQNHMVVWLNPKNDELYARGNSQLKKSTDDGNTYVVSDAVYENTYAFSNDKNKNFIYRVAQSSNYIFLVSDSNGTEGSWVQRYRSNNKLFYSVDTSNSGHIYLADGNKIYRSTNYGQTFGLFKVMNSQLLGIYKKPATNHLYILDQYYIYQLIDTVSSIIKSVDPTHVSGESPLISEFELNQNYPNPFNPSTRIQYQISSNSHVSLKVYDVLGNEVAILVNEYKPAGSYEVEFNSTETRHGVSLPSGVYIYTLRAGDYFTSRKMLLLK